MSRALIIGHTGQDGRLLQDQLLARGDVVVGASRSVDLLNAPSVGEMIAAAAPGEVYYLAAHHHSSQEAASHDVEVWRESWNVHVQGFGNVLSALQRQIPGARVFYAASSRVFGHPMTPTQNEGSPRLPEDPYGLTKAAGMMLAQYYRRVHGLFVACGILFNHESPLRGSRFVTQRVVRGLVAISRGHATTLEVGSLDARVDWGYAPDYTRAMQMILALDEPDDFVVATGETHSVRELIEAVALHLGVDWNACVKETGSLLHRPSQPLCGDASKLRKATGWIPSVDFSGLVERLVAAALAAPDESTPDGVNRH